MFHHLHDELHMPTQGSLSAQEFREMIRWLNLNYSLIGAREYKAKFEENTLESNDVCLSFDDALKCQYDIAIPILEEYQLDAFFFVYSSAFIGNSNLLEIYRYFRTSCFKHRGILRLFFQAVEKIILRDMQNIY